MPLLQEEVLGRTLNSVPRVSHVTPGPGLTVVLLSLRGQRGVSIPGSEGTAMGVPPLPFGEWTPYPVALGIPGFHASGWLKPS